MKSQYKTTPYNQIKKNLRVELCCSEIRTKMAANHFVPSKLDQVLAAVLSYNNST
jgi:hypothetical protein